MIRKLVVALALGTLVLSACGGGASDASPDESVSQPEVSASPAESAADGSGLDATESPSPTPTPTVEPLLTDAQIAELSAVLSSREREASQDWIQESTRRLRAVAKELGVEGQALLDATEAWDDTRKKWRKDLAKKTIAGSQESLKTVIVREPCAFNKVLNAAADLDPSLVHPEIERFRQTEIVDILRAPSESETSVDSATSALGFGWAPLIAPRLCSALPKGSPKILATATLQKKEDSWIWSGDPDGIFYSAVLNSMRGYFKDKTFFAIELIPGKVVSGFSVNLEKGTGTDPWTSILAGPWWGGCTGMSEAENGLGLVETPYQAQGCLLI